MLCRHWPVQQGHRNDDRAPSVSSTEAHVDCCHSIFRYCKYAKSYRVFTVLFLKARPECACHVSIFTCAVWYVQLPSAVKRYQQFHCWAFCVDISVPVLFVFDVYVGLFYFVSQLLSGAIVWLYFVIEVIHRHLYKLFIYVSWEKRIPPPCISSSSCAASSLLFLPLLKCSLLLKIYFSCNLLCMRTFYVHRIWHKYFDILTPYLTFLWIWIILITYW